MVKGFEDLLDRLCEVLTGPRMIRVIRELRQGIPAAVWTMYKRKDCIVLPVNALLVDGANPGGEYLWKEFIVEREMEDARSENGRTREHR
jgi:hypothetical protein